MPVSRVPSNPAASVTNFVGFDNRSVLKRSPQAEFLEADGRRARFWCPVRLLPKLLMLVPANGTASVVDINRSFHKRASGTEQKYTRH